MSSKDNNPRNPRNFSKEGMIKYLQNFSSAADKYKARIAEGGKPESWCMPKLDKYKANMEVLLKEIVEMETHNNDYPQYILEEHPNYQNWFNRAVDATGDFHTNFNFYDVWTCYL